MRDLMDHNLDKLRQADLKNAIGTSGVARTAISALLGHRTQPTSVTRDRMQSTRGPPRA
jgi:hypothetical protein